MLCLFRYTTKQTAKRGRNCVQLYLKYTKELLLPSIKHEHQVNILLHKALSITLHVFAYITKLQHRPSL